MIKIGLTVQEFRGVPVSTWVRMANIIGLPHIEFDLSVFEDIERLLPHLQSSVTIHAPYFSDYGFDLGSGGSSGLKAEGFLKNIQAFENHLEVQGVVVHPPNDPKGSHETYFNRLAEIPQLIHLENMPNQSWEHFFDFYQEVDSKLGKHVGFCFDVPHSFITNGNKLLDLPHDLLGELKSKRGYIHISGGNRQEDTHLPLNQGSLPMDLFEKFVRRIQFQGTLVMELRPRNIDDFNGIFDSFAKMTMFLPWRPKLRLRLRNAIGRRFVIHKARQLLVSRPSEGRD